MFFGHPSWRPFLNRGGSFTELVQEIHGIQPSSHDRPWGLNVDGITPGNVLGRAERKTWCVYTSFLQFKGRLCHEEAWLAVACERSTWVSSLDAGVLSIMDDHQDRKRTIGKDGQEKRGGSQLFQPSGCCTLHLSAMCCKAMEDFFPEPYLMAFPLKQDIIFCSFGQTNFHLAI